MAPSVANPFSPYSVQKHPEPQICPKFVPAIVCGGSFLSRGLKFDWNPPKQSLDKFWTNLGLGVFLNAERGKGFASLSHKSGPTPKDPSVLKALQPRLPLTGVSWPFRAQHPERVSKESPWTFRPRGVRKNLKTVSEVSKQSVFVGAKKSTQTFFVQSFSKTLRVTDVRAENRGRPHQKVRRR